MTNHMKEIAQMLGVELEERFYIGENNQYHYYLTENGLYCDEMKCNKYDEQTQWFCATMLAYLLSGRATLKRMPCKLSYHTTYYSIGPDGVLEPGTWMNDFVDRALYKIGNCYRTPQEAEADCSKWIEFYKSDSKINI